MGQTLRGACSGEGCGADGAELRGLAERCDHAGRGGVGAVLCVRAVSGRQPADRAAEDRGAVSGQSSLSVVSAEPLQLRDEHELYFREHPRQTDRDYLLSVFDELAKLPSGTKDVFGGSTTRSTRCRTGFGRCRGGTAAVLSEDRCGHGRSGP